MGGGWSLAKFWFSHGCTDPACKYLAAPHPLKHGDDDDDEEDWMGYSIWKFQLIYVLVSIENSVFQEKPTDVVPLQWSEVGVWAFSFVHDLPCIVCDRYAS